MGGTMSQQPSFIETQYQFSQAIRDPENAPIPEDIEQRRMAIYQDLFYNNIEGFIANAFPVLRQITTDESWQAMIRDFMQKHHCSTPLFHEIAREFLTYLDNERSTDNDPIFIKELAHYEWVELALSVSDAEVKPFKIQQGQDSLSFTFTTSPVAWTLPYHYPVHLISPEFQPEQANEQPLFLLVYRNHDDGVTFLELNPVSARLIDLLNQGFTGQIAAEQITEQLQHPSPEVVIAGARSLIDDWLQRDILELSH
jgi:hypothetical protein